MSFVKSNQKKENIINFQGHFVANRRADDTASAHQSQFRKTSQSNKQQNLGFSQRPSFGTSRINVSTTNSSRRIEW